jgi:hypothetical protein
MNDYRAEIDRLRAELAAARQLNRDWEESFDAARFEQMSEDLAAARQDAERMRICAGALTPVSENEKRGMERILAILDRKIAEGGAVVSSDAGAVERHNAHYRARWSAFIECATMLRAALSSGGTP